MHGVFGNAGSKSNEANDRTDAEKTSCDTSVGENWFANICKGLFYSKAGTALHYYTGFDERSCQRYASGNVSPPGIFVRALLRGDQGHVYLAAIMDDCKAPWWLEYRRAEAVWRKLKEVDQEII